MLMTVIWSIYAYFTTKRVLVNKLLILRDKIKSSTNAEPQMIEEVEEGLITPIKQSSFKKLDVNLGKVVPIHPMEYNDLRLSVKGTRNNNNRVFNLYDS